MSLKRLMACVKPDSEELASDTLFQHFEQFDRWDWCEVAEEGRYVNRLMFGDSIDPDAPRAAVLSAVAACAAQGAFAAMAAALGVGVNALMAVMMEWYESQDAPPSPVTLDELMNAIDDAQRKQQVGAS